jgi:hypothetical protein
MAKVINFENRIQKALFDHELKGQISDGYWENSKPYDHYKSFSGVETRVDPEKPGKSGFFTRRSYNFANKELFDVVGKRMVAIANLADKGYSPSDMDDFQEYWSQYENPGDSEYWQKKAKRFSEVFGSKEAWERAVSGEWNEKNVKPQLKRMSQLITEDME